MNTNTATNLTPKTVTTTIEILGKLYPVRCLETELPSLQEAASFLNKQMLEVQESGKAINIERIAIITALNMTHQFLQLDTQQTSLVGKINQRISQLQSKLDTAINRALQKELVYSAE
jgi:cell division protein ZapA